MSSPKRGRGRRENSITPLMSDFILRFHRASLPRYRISKAVYIRSITMYRALRARRNKEKKSETKRERCCARERRVLRNHGLWEPGVERSGEKRRVKPVGRALCASGRSFSISPHSSPLSLYHPLFTISSSFPLSLYLSLFLSHFFHPTPFSLSLARLFLSFLPVSTSSLPSALFAFSPFCHPSWTPSTCRYHLDARLELK